MMMHDRKQTSAGNFEVTIEKLVYGGAGLGRYAGKVVFVPFSAPGDRLVVRAVEQKKNFIRAGIVRIIEPGPDRVVPSCTHFARCGGCQWQHIEYRCQAETKRVILEEAVHHHFPETRDLNIGMKPAPQPYGYRSRARIQVRGLGAGASVGFFRFASRSIEDVESCPLFHTTLNSALASVRESRQGVESDGAIQQVALACSPEQGTWSTVEVDPALEEGFSSPGRPEHILESDVLLRRKIAGIEYAFSPSAFFQSNDSMLEQLVSGVAELWADSGIGAALDLFCGVGLFTLPLARSFQQVVAVENSGLACRLCEHNAAEAGLANIRVVSADVAAWMNSLHSVSAPCFDLVLLDPPRSGAGSTVMEFLAQWAPETIIYVSCDPQTLCRDIALLPSRDYRIDYVEGLDLFPETYHFETVIRLRRRTPF